MNPVPLQFVLGSRSPRRLELLQTLVPAESILVLPPRSTEESGFESLHELSAIQLRIREIARSKCEDVLNQVRELEGERDDTTIPIVITADTTIIVTEKDGRLSVLGQPPDDRNWQEIVKYWFREYYADKTHCAVTALCVATPTGRMIERVATSEVTFHSDVDRRLDWYLKTGEPLGKAGGYAIQGAGSIFVSRVEGSLSNVIGLPLEELIEIFEELEIGNG
ncbi:MAG: Maf family protein [Planctomycetes bacterium]|nr:Maf family protein [Planctomycetota bacterium]